VTIEETFADIADAVMGERSKFYGVTTGQVINIADPLTLGRVQVRLPFLDSLDLSPWARVATPMAGILSGAYFSPSIGDEVLVAFEQGDVNAPYVLGGLWNAMSPPPQPFPIPGLAEIRTLAGAQIVFLDTPPTVTIQSGPTLNVPAPAVPTPAGPATIIVSPTGIQLIFGLNIVSLTSAGVTITANPTLTITATGSINLNAPTVTINGAAATNVQSGGVCNVTAPLVKIN
jgi:phage baseplate assembly protein gpV